MRYEDIGVDLDRGGEAGAADVRNSRELREGRHEPAELRLEGRGTLDEAFALDDVDVDEAGDAGASMAGVRSSVQKRGSRLVPERGADAPARDHRGEGDVSGADPLRTRHEVGDEAIALAPEPASETSEAGNDLVRDEEHVPLAADLRHRGPVPIGRRDNAAGTDHRLPDQSRHPGRPTLREQGA